MRILFVMDPVSTVIVDEDTTFALMLEAQSRGHEVEYCLLGDLFVEGSSLGAKARAARCQRDPAAPITLGPYRDLDVAADLDVVFMRKDPPFDVHYLWACQLLEHARGETLLINDPRGLRDANEKIYATYFPEIMPRTLVTDDKARIKDFVKRHGGKGVLKPLGMMGGHGIFLLSDGDANLNAMIETTTAGGKSAAMVQEFLPSVDRGDKRILLLDGEYLGAINRVATGGDLRSNIHVGGRVEAAELSDEDRAIVERVAPRLREDGLVFVGLDVIGGKLTEVNVTSPTGIQQASRLMQENLEARVIAWIEKAIA
ncbi:MAG: glutathione synthase [Sandaracinaceae bacterium]